MITPPYLKTGDNLGIVAPAKWISEENYPAIIKCIENHGLVPVRGKTTTLQHGPFAGSDKERLTDLQRMIDDDTIRAIFCLRGGYGTIRILDQIDLSPLTKNPKWLVGFSDITMLHSLLNNRGLESIHGQMPIHFGDDARKEGIEKLFSVLKGEPLSYRIDSHPLNLPGKTEGVVTGGNLAIITSLIGTPFDVDFTGKILFIEDVGEYLYRLDRMMHQLKLSGKLTQLSGLIVGGLSEMLDNSPGFGQSAEEIIADAVSDYHYPVWFNFPAGHIPANFPLIMGREAEMLISPKECSLTFRG